MSPSSSNRCSGYSSCVLDGTEANISLSPYQILAITLGASALFLLMFAIYYWCVVMHGSSTPLKDLGMSKCCRRNGCISDDDEDDEKKAEPKPTSTSPTSWELSFHSTTLAEMEKKEVIPEVHRHVFRAPRDLLTDPISFHRHHRDRHHHRHHHAVAPPLFPSNQDADMFVVNVRWNNNNQTQNDRPIRQEQDDSDSRVYVMPNGIPFGHHAPIAVSSQSSRRSSVVNYNQNNNNSSRATWNQSISSCDHRYV
jgi:hypothetical protein